MTELKSNLVALKRDEVLEEVKVRAAKGEDPAKILVEGQEAMKIIGDKFQAGDFFLAELILSSVIFKAIAAELKPYLGESGAQDMVAKIILVTLKGDIHDIGKDLFGDLLRARNFEVIDLGVDINPSVVIEKVRDVKPDFLGFSALMTTTFEVMNETAKMLEKEGLRSGLQLMIGGGVTTSQVKEMIGADFQTLDAMEGVNFCEQFVSGGK
jgi:methanogenic corrinoid protein MtbC1